MMDESLVYCYVMLICAKACAIVVMLPTANTLTFFAFHFHMCHRRSHTTCLTCTGQCDEWFDEYYV
jgi:hypothetical protein